MRDFAFADEGVPTPAVDVVAGVDEEDEGFAVVVEEGVKEGMDVEVEDDGGGVDVAEEAEDWFFGVRDFGAIVVGQLSW